jgi:hypothetical protein
LGVFPPECTNAAAIQLTDFIEPAWADWWFGRCSSGGASKKAAARGVAYLRQAARRGAGYTSDITSDGPPEALHRWPSPPEALVHAPSHPAPGAPVHRWPLPPRAANPYTACGAFVRTSTCSPATVLILIGFSRATFAFAVSGAGQVDASQDEDVAVG